jgi:transcription antitermination factor NusG
VPEQHSSHGWFALRVKSGREKSVALAVRSKGFEEFSPLYRWRQTWSDRKKWVEMPLFPGYVFCRLDSVLRFPLLTIPGVLKFVSFGERPVPIDDAEIASVQAAVRSALVTEPYSFLDGGPRVRIGRGPLAGTEGILIGAGEQSRVVVNITILRRSIAVNVENRWVEPLALQMTAGNRSL